MIYIGPNKQARNGLRPGHYLTISAGDRVRVEREPDGKTVAWKQSRVDGPYRGAWFAAIVSPKYIKTEE